MACAGCPCVPLSSPQPPLQSTHASHPLHLHLRHRSGTPQLVLQDCTLGLPGNEQEFWLFWSVFFNSPTSIDVTGRWVTGGICNQLL